MSGPAKATNRVSLTVGGAQLARFTKVSISRDLSDISGGFSLDCVDVARAMAALPVNLDRPPFFPMIREGMACTVAIDGEVVLVGHIDDADPVYNATSMNLRICGRDATGDLVDCAALPNGPAEFRGVDLLHVAQIVCAPYGISVRAETDVGPPFERLAVRPHEDALPFLEGAARQRAVLLVSDGVGGLLLTRGGNSRGPARLAFGDNIVQAQGKFSWRHRFSDYFVKGQTDASARRRHRGAALGHAVAPAAGEPAANTGASADEAVTILPVGHARDPQITRWRPTVRLTRSQSGMTSTQEQAEWALRVARGEGETLTYSVLDWRAGPKRALWRTNQLVAVQDPYADIDRDMLIAGVAYEFGEQGAVTQLRVCGVSAFDRINEAEKRRHRNTDKKPAAKTALKVV